MNQLILTGSTVLLFALLLLLVSSFFKKLSRHRNTLQLRFLHSVANTVIIVLGIYSVLAQFSLTREISASLLQSGTLIIAVATFAAQQALGNVISGISISIAKPLEIGQKVRIQSGGTTIAEGIVTNMTLRHIVIQQIDGQSCVVPNAVLDSSVIVSINYTKPVGNFLEFEVAYDTDLDLARRLIRQAVQEEPLVSQKDVSILTSRVTANGLILKFSVWSLTLDDNFQACSNIRERVVQDFLRNNIQIPYNTVTVNSLQKQEMTP